MATNTNPKKRKRSKLRTIVTVSQVLILLAISASVGISLGLFVNLSQMLPTVGNIEAPEATIIYSSDGRVLARIFREDRTNVALEDVPAHLKQATIAIEDKRFYKHSGIDMRGIFRAVVANIGGGGLEQGGSTITQQLARNVYLTQKKTYQRKIQEAVLAVLIERNFTKDQILEHYLNRVYYGSKAFGVEAASKIYFGKSTEDLTLGESAMLAGLPQRPSDYSPHENLKAALNRRDVVLNRMAEDGYITKSERDKAKEAKIIIVPRKPSRGHMAPHFVEYVLRQLRDRYGDDVVYGGGLRVYTTLNYDMQKAGEKALREGVKKHSKAHKVTEGCLVAVEPDNGYIRAMVGSVDPRSYYNRCCQGHGRQPGSTFKAFVYAAAMESGMTPSTTVKDEKISYPDGRKVWRPQNYDNKYRGTVTIKRAVVQSINIPAIKIADKVGIKKVIKYAQLMGITAELNPYLALAIGGIKGVHPLEMASAYGTFANDGVYVPYCSIVKVANSEGEIIEEHEPQGKRVLRKRSNKYMDEMFRAVVTAKGGTGYNAKKVPGARGKTGTTNSNRDAWFIGYVPHRLSTAVWIGNDDNSSMYRAWGGLICAPIWSEFMNASVPILNRYQPLSKDIKDKYPDKPVEIDKDEKDEEKEQVDSIEADTEDEETDEGAGETEQMISVTICDDSQLLATKNCKNTHTEKFLKGTEPRERCHIHSKPQERPDSGGENKQPAASEETLVTITVCPDSGLLATPNCPNRVKKRVGIEDVPTQVCPIHSGSAD